MLYCIVNVTLRSIVFFSKFCIEFNNTNNLLLFAASQTALYAGLGSGMLAAMLIVFLLYR